MEADWIKEPYDPDVIFQLDRYHIYQEILRKLSDKRAQKEARKLLRRRKRQKNCWILFWYMLNSVETTNPIDKRSEKARELHKCLNNNKEGLLPYQKQEKQIPAPKKELSIKTWGVQESQNCAVITLRMKHRRMRWSVKGANNLAKSVM